MLHDLQLQEQERKANDRLEQRLREEKARADDRVNDVLTELHAALTELQEVKESLEQHTLEKSALTVQLESVLAAKAQVTLDLQNTRITLEKVNKDLVVSYEATIAALKGSGDQAQARLQELTAELHAQRVEIKELREEAERARSSTSENHRTEVENLKGTISALEKKVIRAEQQQEINDLKFEACNQTIAEQKRSISLLESSLAQREGMIQVRESAVQSKDVIIQSLEGKAVELERSKLALEGSLQSMQLKLDDQYVRVRELDRSLERERDSRLRVEERLEETKKTYEEKLEELRAQSALRQQQADQRLIEKTMDMEASKARVADDLNARIGELTAALHAKSDECHLTKLDLAALTAEKAKLEEQFHQYTERTESSMRETTAASDATVSALLSKIHDFEQQVKDLLAQVESKTSEIEKLEEVKKNLTEEVATVTRMRQRADEKIEVQAQRIELLESAKMNVQSELHQKNQRIDSFDGVKKDLEAQIALLNQEVLRQERTLLEKMNKIESLQKTITANDSHMEEMESRLRDMEDGIFDNSRTGQLQANRLLELENAKRSAEEMLSRVSSAKSKLEATVTKQETQISDLQRRLLELEQDREREQGQLMHHLEHTVGEKSRDLEVAEPWQVIRSTVA